MRFVLPLLALVACDATLPAETADSALPAEELAPPVELITSAALPGQALTLDVYGANPGETVKFFYSLNGVAASPGTGPVLPGVGLRANLNAPVLSFPGGSAVADRSGHASYSFTIPAGARPGTTVGVEAAARGAVGGRTAYQTAGKTVVVGSAVCADDSFEPNDLPNLAPAPGEGTQYGLRSCPGDVDLYAVWANAGDWITGTAWFTHAQGDVDLAILDTDGVTVLASSTSTSDWEQAHYTAPVSGYYFIQINLYGESDANLGNDYVMDIGAATPPPVLSSGTARVRGTWSFDLDAGRETELWRRVQNDFWWEQITSTTRQLTPEGGAMFGVWGMSEPGWGDCLAATRSTAPIDGSGPSWSDLAVGTWVCGYTADNHVTKFQVQAAQPYPDNTMTLAWTTWENPTGYTLIAEGQVTIPGTWSFDLDDGAVTAWTGDEDFWWQQMTSTTRQLTPRNGALFAPMGMDIAGPIACDGMTLTADPIRGDDLSTGLLSPFRTVCVETSLGQRAAFSVVSVDGSQNNGLVLGYAIWQ